MDKFIERANELIARLESFGNTSRLDTIVALSYASEDSGELYRAKKRNYDALEDCLLDARILLYEFNCPPLYEEAMKAIGSQDPEGPELCRLLRKLIETAELRRQGCD